MPQSFGSARGTLPEFRTELFEPPGNVLRVFLLRERVFARLHVTKDSLEALRCPSTGSVVNDPRRSRRHGYPECEPNPETVHSRGPLTRRPARRGPFRGLVGSSGSVAKAVRGRR